MRRMQQACEDTQIALERSARGALLGAAEQSLLANHLPTCPACRAFARTREETEKLMNAHAEVLRREVDLTALGEAAHAAIRKQKRSMVRGLMGLAAIVAVCLWFYATTHDPAILWPGLGLLGLGAYAIAGDLGRLEMTRRWAEEAPRLDLAAAKAERWKAVPRLAVAVVLAALTQLIPGTVGYVVHLVLNLVGIIGCFHYVFVIRTLSREIKALRD